MGDYELGEKSTYNSPSIDNVYESEHENAGNQHVGEGSAENNNAEDSYFNDAGGSGTEDAHPYDTAILSNKWNFITFTRHHYHVTKKDDRDIRIRNIIINAICWTTIVLGVVVLQTGYSGAEGFHRDTTAQLLKIVINGLSLVLIVMLIEYRFLNIKLDMRKWQSEDIGFSFRSRTCLRNMAYLVLELILVIPQPVAFIPKVDQLALMMILRLFFILRLVRDYHPLYRKRRVIWKDPRLLYSHNPDMFHTLTVFRVYFKQHTAIVVAAFCIFIGLVSSYSLYVADRGRADPGTIWLDYIYLTVITATTVGYGDFSPQTSISKVVAMLTAVCGTILTALVVGVFTSLLTPSDFHKEASTWLRIQSQKKEREEYSAQFIQLVFRRFCRKKKFSHRGAREERKYNRECIRLITRLRHLRKSAQWTKIASTHPLQFQLQDLESKYQSIQIELQSTNRKLDQLLKVMSASLKEDKPEEAKVLQSSSTAVHHHIASPELRPTVYSSPPTF